jgi:selenocysteine lyase/cysteine desulfurase
VAAALAAACREVAALPAGALAAHEDVLRAGVLGLLRELPDVQELPGWPDARRFGGVVSFTVRGHDARSVAAALTVRHGLPGVDAPAATVTRLRLDTAWAEEDVDRLRHALEDVLTSA